MTRWEQPNKRYIDTRKDGMAPERPQPGSFVSGVRDDYALDIGRMSLTPAKLGTIYRRADTGDTDQLFEVFNAVEEDPHVHSVLSKRKDGVLSRTFEISSALEDDDKAQAAADIANQLILGKDGVDGIENWDDGLGELADAAQRAFSLSQIVWDTSGQFPEPRMLKRVPHRECVLGEPYSFGSDNVNDSDRVRIKTDANRIEGEDLATAGGGTRSNWILVINKARNDALAKSSLMRIITWWWMFKHFSVRDWLIFCDRYGMPIRKGTYTDDANGTSRSAVVSAVKNLGRDAWCALPVGCDIELIDAAMKGDIPYPKLIETVNFEISKAVLGGTLTTEAGDKGARSLGEVHQAAERMIANKDAKRLAGAIRRDLVTPCVRFHLGPGYPIPRCEFLTDEEEDLKARAERDKILSKDIGLPMTEAYFYETYQVPEPADGQALIVPAKPAPAFGQPPPPGDPANDNEPPTDDEVADAVDVAASLGFPRTIALKMARTKWGSTVIKLARRRV